MKRNSSEKVLEKELKPQTKKFIEKAQKVYNKRLLRTARKKDGDGAVCRTFLKMHCEDLADTLLVCYLILGKEYRKAVQEFEALDTEVRELFPNSLVDKLYQFDID